jgi:hypothetical protein
VLAVGSLRLESFQPCSLDDVGNDAEISSSAGDIESGSERDRLASIRDFRLNKGVKPRVDAFGNLVEKGRSLPHSPVGPLCT